ncbi:dihydropteroate synthase [Suttonella sp. R2A3]|uniref:dihydropteroate synthase n=1 Tax=Suttonella sp. R2A3 TaxID=2908648 RepID=UPI001F3B2DAA|nr:dihydropteroate synthase [Suttonella sp. R2A3]UJF24668.1 dihydropteroate synthase [Suttonella sp. R2A3]
MKQRLAIGRFQLDLTIPRIMGVLNCTPDSFSDGGDFLAVDAALARAEEMIASGVDIIDVGAESTRPGSQAITAEEEIKRLTPIVTALVADGRKPISIDTKKTAVMRVMLELGVDMINDVHGFEDPGAWQAVADAECALCIMHMRGMPETMQDNTDYQNVIDEVAQYLDLRVKEAERAGVALSRIVIDPGFGFGKTPAQNMALIKHIHAFNPDVAKLVGVSRKSTIGHYLHNKPVGERLIGSVTLAALAVWQGADIVRVHDVSETRDALAMVKALKMG